MKNMNRLVLVAALVALCGVAATASAEDPVVRVENQGTALVFYPVVEFKEMILTVTGPCDYQYRQVVEKGTPYFKLDERTIDGAYTANDPKAARSALYKNLGGLKFEDVIRDTEADTDADDFASRFDLDFSLMILELAAFLPQLLDSLGGEALPEAA